MTPLPIMGKFTVHEGWATTRLAGSRWDYIRQTPTETWRLTGKERGANGFPEAFEFGMVNKFRFFGSRLEESLRFLQDEYLHNEAGRESNTGRLELSSQDTNPLSERSWKIP